MLTELYVILSILTACADCVTELSPWSECVDGLKTQIEIVVSAAVGTGKACPEVLASNEEGYLLVLYYL